MIVFEVIGGLILFAFLSLMSFIILPSLLGCFGFILFLMVFIALMVAFSASIGWFIVFVIACYALVAVIRVVRYSQLPDYDKYLTENLNVYNDGQVHCCNCGSAQLMHVGLFGLRSKLRYYVCMSCRKHLYRFKVL